jgi:hypothetical protein
MEGGGLVEMMPMPGERRVAEGAKDGGDRLIDR